MIHFNYDNILLKPNIILQLYRGLYKFNTVTFDGQYKNVDNVIEETEQDRVAKIIEDTFGKITKRDILEKFPDIIGTTVQRALANLLKEGKIIKIGGGRYTSYTWNREDE